MLGHRELEFDDYVAILRRRLWVILIPTVVVPVVVYLISLKIPNRYTSQTLVLIESQKVPESYVRSVVSEELGFRLGTMQEQILSRTRLQPIIERFSLYKEDASKVPMEELVDRMRKSISVRPVISEISSRGGGLPGFYVNFTSDNPRLAQQVCGEITSMFMEENLKAREQSAMGTTDFLRNQVEEAKRKLDEQDKKFAEFKMRYIGQLPGQEQTNLSMLMGLNTQLEAVTQALSRAQQDKTYTESLLAQQIAAWKASQGSNNPLTLDQQLSQAQSQLVMLEARYTPDHPDVIKQKNDVAQLKKKLAEAEAAGTTEPQPGKSNPLLEPPQVQQLRNQIYSLDQTIKEKKQQQERLQKDIGTYQARVQLSPVVEEQFKNLTRDYQTALNFYNELLSKKTQSEMATDLERRQQGEQFRVMDPPNLPEKPSYPDRLTFAIGGLVGGLGLGFGIALLIELLDKSLRTEKDVEFYLELPALAVLPRVAEDNVNGNRNSNGNKIHFWQRIKRPAAHAKHAVGG